MLMSCLLDRCVVNIKTEQVFGFCHEGDRTMSDFAIEVMSVIMSAKDPEAALAAAYALVKEFAKAEGIDAEHQL